MRSRSGGLDLLQARVVFRDRSVSDVLDLALRFFAVHGRRYAKAGLASLVPLAAVCVAAGMLLGPVAAWTVAAPLATLAEIPFAVLASRRVFHEDVRTPDVLGAALRDAPRLIFARALALVLVFLGLAFFLIPGVWLSVIFLFTTEVMLLERSGLGAAIGRSHRIAGSGVSEALLGTIVTWLVPIGARSSPTSPAAPSSARSSSSALPARCGRAAGARSRRSVCSRRCPMSRPPDSSST
jgi:hypothetical protein